MKISLQPTLIVCAALLSLNLTAQAQPDVNNAPKADNPANRQRRVRPTMPANMTAEERVKWLVKLQFSRLGATEAQQEALATFVQGETQARQKLQTKAQPLQTALRAGVLTDIQIAGLLNTYQVALEDEKTRRALAIAQLNRAIDFKTAPKIEAALVVAGLIGDGPALNSGGMERGFLRGMTNRGQNGAGRNGNGRAGVGGGRNGRNGENGQNGENGKAI